MGSRLWAASHSHLSPLHTRFHWLFWVSNTKALEPGKSQVLWASNFCNSGNVLKEEECKI